MSEEIWKTVKNYDYYEVSSHGRVRSLSQRVPRILSRSWNDENRASVHLQKDGKNRTKPVSRLMLETFVGLPKPGEYSVPRDADQENLKLENWKWSTRRRNDTPASK